jgi:hypothetical protein
MRELKRAVGSLVISGWLTTAVASFFLMAVAAHAAVMVDTGTGPQGPMILPPLAKPKPAGPSAAETAGKNAANSLKNFFKFTGKSTTASGDTSKIKSVSNTMTPLPSSTPVSPKSAPLNEEPEPPSPDASSVDTLAIPTVTPKTGTRPSAGTNGKRPSLLTPTPLGTALIDEPQVSPTDPPRIVFKRIDDPNNALGLTAARNRLKSAQNLIASKQTASGQAALESLKDWLVTATEAHIDLYKTLNRLPSARVQGEFEKQLALEFAKLRDQTLFELSRLYLQQGKKDQAVKLLVAVVQSQTRSQVGLDAYKLLQDMGFTEALQITE